MLPTDTIEQPVHRAVFFHSILVYCGRIMRIERDVKLDFDDVLIRPKRSTLGSRNDVDLLRTFSFPHGARPWTGIPIIAANMDGIGTFSMMRALALAHLLTALHKHHDEKAYTALAHEYAFISIGAKDTEMLRLKKILRGRQPRFLCIDVANGYTEKNIAFVRKIRATYPKAALMAGNVVTGEMTEQMILSGADIVKIGIGPGSVCTTRSITGVGYPQLSAIIECADAAHGLGGLVCADGGCRTSGDVAKAFGAGADFVMLGGMLAGHDESESAVVEKNGKKYVEFYGSSSETAMQKHAGGRAIYRAAEGKTVLIPYRGAIKTTLEEILGGLRSACTYVGARRLKELSKRTTFILVNRQLNTAFETEDV